MDNVQFPSIGQIAGLVAWAYLYAPADRPLNESHRLWGKFYPLSEWFREKIVIQLTLPETTTWEDIYRLTGWLVEEEYGSPEEFQEAHHLGENTFIHTDGAMEQYRRLRDVKRWIVDRG